MQLALAGNNRMGASRASCRFIPGPPTLETMTVLLKPFLLGGIYAEHERRSQEDQEEAL